MMFLKYTLSWVSQNLAIPFWAVGHLHLSLKLGVYQDLHIILASCSMNLICLIGFIVDYRDFAKSNREPDGKEFLV